MPTKQWLMDNYDSAKEILDYAAANHNTSVQLVYVKHSGGQVVVRCKDASTPSTVYDGSGATKKEAMADCISTEFPS